MKNEDDFSQDNWILSLTAIDYHLGVGWRKDIEGEERLLVWSLLSDAKAASVPCVRYIEGYSTGSSGSTLMFFLPSCQLRQAEFVSDNNQIHSRNKHVVRTYHNL